MKFYRRDYLLFQVTVFSKTNYCTSYKNYLHSFADLDHLPLDAKLAIAQKAR